MTALDPGGQPRRAAPRRRRLRWVVLAGALLAAAWLAMGAMKVLDAKAAAEAAAKRANDLRASLKPAELLSEDGPDPLGGLDTVERDFRRAAADLRSPWVWPIRYLPVLGRQVDVVHDLAASGATVVEALHGAATDLRRVLPGAWRDPTKRAGVLAEVSDICNRTLRAVDSVSLGPSKGLVGPVGRKRQEFSDKLDAVRGTLRRAAAVSAGLADMLRGPRRYLVMMANNAEMRAGSGMFLSAGALEAGDGRFSLGEVRSFDGLVVPGGQALLDPDLASLWGWLHPDTDFRMLGLTPRFAASAAAAAQMWELAGGGKVDGVIALDAVALAAMLEVTGPIESPAGHLDAGYVVEYLLHDQYGRFEGQDDVDTRREQLGLIAAAAFGAFDSGGWDVAAMGRSLDAAAKGRHILAWSSVPVEEEGWEAAGLAGGITAEDLALSVLSRGANKLDWFLGVDAALTIEGRSARLRVTLRNRTPEGEARYVAGPGENGVSAEGEYVGILVFNVPDVATKVTLGGDSRLAIAGKDGPSRQVGGEVRIRRGEERTVELSFELPEHGSFEVVPSARVPPVDWAYAGEAWRDTEPRTIAW